VREGRSEYDFGPSEIGEKSFHGVKLQIAECGLWIGKNERSTFLESEHPTSNVQRSISNEENQYLIFFIQRSMLEVEC
jgi:hypothetical protein